MHAQKVDNSSSAIRRAREHAEYLNQTRFRLFAALHNSSAQNRIVEPLYLIKQTNQPCRVLFLKAILFLSHSFVCYGRRCCCCRRHRCLTLPIETRSKMLFRMHSLMHDIFFFVFFFRFHSS